MSCYDFFQDKNSTLILTHRSNLVSYHPSKDFVMFGQDYQTLKNLPMIVKQFINAIIMFDSDYIIIYNTACKYPVEDLSQWNSFG